MPSKLSSLGKKTAEYTKQSTQSVDPRPEDLPFDASPGTDEEFGVRAATMHVQRQSKRDHTSTPGKGTEHFADSIEGVLLRLVGPASPYSL
jgi:hypothetical protein